MAGFFISMEGADGAGKSTQIRRLKSYLLDKGYDIIECREPGGNAVSEAIREVILNPEYKEMGNMTELLLYTAARAQLMEEVIRPALAEGKVVICDRFVDSSAVYQGIARGMGVDLVYDVNRYAIGDTMPDVTILLDVKGGTGIARKKEQAELDRIEQEAASFHEKVSEGYRSLAERYPERICRIDGTMAIEEIFEQIAAIIDDRLH